MNREREYQDILSLHAPPALQGTVLRAQIREKKRRAVRTRVIMPVGAVAAVFALFVTLINVSPTAVSAMERIPGLRQLAEAVSFSSSLTAAVEHEFVQPIGLTQTINGVTMRVEHVIVDQRRLHIFYTLDSHTELGTAVGGRVSAVGEDGRIITGSWAIRENAEIYQWTAEFASIVSEEEGWVTEDIPDVVVFERHVFDNSGDFPREPIAIFEFTLELDLMFTQKGEVIELNHDFILDGQCLTVMTVEINPTHTRVEIIGDENNTAWVRGLWFYLENERGERFYPPHRRGIIANPRAGWDTMAVETHFLEGAFFSESETLYMVIDEVQWLDKDMEHVRVNLASGTADRLPEGMRLESVEQTDDGWILTFYYAERYWLANSPWHIITYSRSLEAIDGRYPRFEHGWYIHEITLGMFFSTGGPVGARGYEAVYFTPQYSRTVTFEEPVRIRVR